MLATSALLAHTSDLNLVIRHVLSGLGHGIHAGRERGAGVEFSEYRAYSPGDEWRRVDWKLLARADRYYVREAERDSHVAVWLWLDASASMAEASQSIKGLTKFAFARSVLACVAAIAQRQGDAFGLIIGSGKQIQFTPAARGARQLQRVLAQLMRASPEGQFPDADTVRASLHFARSPSLIFAVSDFLDSPSPMREALQRLRHMRHDVRALCLQTQAERDGDFSLQTAYCDPERGTAVHGMSSEGKGDYLAQHTAHFSLLATECKKHDITLLNSCIEQPPATVLRAWCRQAGPKARV